MRTINSIRGVKRSRVHLATPPKTVFLEEQRKTTASVVVELENGIHLSEKQIHGIGNLVAKAVEGLDPSDVMILNAEGKTLSKNINDPIALAANNQMESRERVEKDLSLRIETMLSHIVGNGKVAATVTADLDFSVVNETQTTFDSEASAIRSIEKRVDNMSGTRPTNAGAAGATSNGTTPQVAAGNEIKTETSKNNEVTNYEIPQTTRRINSSVGSIKKLSIAIVLDGKPIRVKEGEVMVTKKEPWSTEKIKEFEQIVASAVGLDRKRGDSLEIKNMDFVHEDFEEAERIITAQQNKVWMSNILMYTVFGLSIILFFFFLVRPFIRWLIENTTESVDSFLPQTVEELEKLQKNVGIPNVDEILPILPESLDPNKVEGEMIKEKVITLIDASPDKAALVLKHWLHKKEHEDLSKDKTA
jgi:flagellar M-ring protein FliF